MIDLSITSIDKWTSYPSSDILRRDMENPSTRHAIFVGHLEVTVPAIAAILLVPFFGLRMFGHSFVLYYVLGGIALAWQWYSIALPGWEQWLLGKGVPQEEAENLARRRGLAWPDLAGIGSFALHTTAAAICGVHLGAWLLSRWYVWGLPLLGRSTRIPTGDDWLQHFELTSILPAFFVGYLLATRFRRLATCAWILPTLILAYELWKFTDPYVSVLALGPHSSTRFQYFFVIQRKMATFTPGFGGVDPIRVALQISVVAPFYSGIAYTAGALAARHNLSKRMFGHSLTETGPAIKEEEQAELESPRRRLTVPDRL